MSRSIKKGPFIDAKLMKKVEAAMGSNKKVIIQNLVTRLGHHPGTWLDRQ